MGNPTPNHRPRPLPRRPTQLASCCSPRRREGSSLRAGAEQGGQLAPLSLGLALPRTPALLGVARGPTSRAHPVGEQIVAEAQASGRGRSRLNPGRAPREGRKSGRRLPAQLSGPRCPGGGHVTGGAGPSATPATQPEGLRGLRAAPAPTPDHTHHPRVARTVLRRGRMA